MFDRAPPSYRQEETARYRNKVAQAIDAKVTQNEIFLLSPNGAQWRVVVDDTGALSTTQVLRVT